MPDTLSAWRLVLPRHGARQGAFSGEGARRFGGRWNTPGTALVYTSTSLSLAVLETLVHVDRVRFERDYVTFKLALPGALVLELTGRDLPDDRRARPASEGARRIGDAWAEARASVALSVPSVVVPSERNYLLNPLHPRFAELVIDPPAPFRYDDRFTG